jgi:hypothetical protein
MLLSGTSDHLYHVMLSLSLIVKFILTDNFSFRPPLAQVFSLPQAIYHKYNRDYKAVPWILCGTVL